MAKLTEQEMIARYDAERSGSAYTKPEMPANPSPMLTSLIAWAADEQAVADWIDTPISPVEQQVIAILLKRQPADDAPEDTDSIISVLEAFDGGDRTLIDERFDAVIDRVAELPDNQRAQAIGWLEGFVAGCHTAG